MKTYFCSIRHPEHYRRQAFIKGLQRMGYVEGPLSSCDLYLIWNRYGALDTNAENVERRGGTVIVAENAYLGNQFAGGHWFAMSVSQHNGAGRYPYLGPERWDNLKLELGKWREGNITGQPSDDLVLLSQRGIGPNGIAMPKPWPEQTSKWLRDKGYFNRVRKHPGVTKYISLEEDLKKSKGVATWGSGAALKALFWGIPVFAEFSKWIGIRACRSVKEIHLGALKNDDLRLDVFRRMIWAQWRVEEIESGRAFECLLKA